MYRKRGSKAARPDHARSGGGIFETHIFTEREPSGGAGGYDENQEDIDDVLDETEEGVGPEHLLHEDDREALAVGRSIMGIARAVGSLVRAMTATGRLAVGDVKRGGMRRAVVESLRRAANEMDDVVDIRNDEPAPARWMDERWPEDSYTARAAHDPRDPHWQFHREYGDGDAGPWYTPSSSATAAPIAVPLDDELIDLERAPGDDRPEPPEL
jgi:hypothetical protein